MENNLHNTYLLKAIQAYPYELEKAYEALNYALSYNPESVKALCLMAKIQIVQFGNFNLAKAYYQEALACNVHDADIYPDYIRLLVNNGNYKEAEKLIDFALSFKGTKKANILLAQASLLEAQNNYDKAENVLQEAKIIALNNEFINYVNDVISRITIKRKLLNSNKQVNKPVTKNKPVENKKSWFQNRLNNLL